VTAVAELWEQLNGALLPVFTGYREHISELPIEVKTDRTLLTEADTAIQQMVIEAIRGFDPGAAVIAEEDERTQVRAEILTSGGRVWVVDPIDGTAEFVRADGVEFCTVVCLLEDWQPSAAFVLAPELGAERTPITIVGDVTAREVLLAGKSAANMSGGVPLCPPFVDA